MNALNEVDNVPKENIEESGERRRRSPVGDAASEVVRVRLPLDVSHRVKEAMAELKARGVHATAEDLLAGFFVSLPATYLDDEILRRTPEEYYIQAAVQIPELREKLARQARKALVKKPAAQSLGDSTRKRKRSHAASASSGGETPEAVAPA